MLQPFVRNRITWLAYLMLALYGYGIEISGRYNERTRVVVEAFQRHFRPARVDGIADRSTVETLHNLLGGLLVS